MREIVNVHPILPGKAELIRERIGNTEKLFNDSDGQKALAGYRAEIGYSESAFWLQHLPGQDYFVVHLRGKKLAEKEIWSKFRSRFKAGCPVAINVREFYLDTFGVDFSKETTTPKHEMVCEIVSDFSDEELRNSSIKTYVFCYPLLPGRAEDLRRLYSALSMDQGKMDEWLDSRKQLGVTKMTMWIQQSENSEYLVVSQDLIGPLRAAREKWVEESIGDGIVGQMSQIYSMLTGLASMQLIPDLESLTDPTTASETPWELEEVSTLF